MPTDRSAKGRDYQVTTKKLAIAVFIIFVTYIFAILVLLMHFIPMMESAGEETRRIIGDSGDESVVADEPYDGSVIKSILIISVIAFGILDGIMCYTLLKRKIPQGKEMMVTHSFQLYPWIRLFGGMMIPFITSGIYTAEDPRFLMNLLYLVVVSSIIASLAFIFFFFRKVLTENNEDGILFRIPDDVPH